jgi:hypothetical protein
VAGRISSGGERPIACLRARAGESCEYLAMTAKPPTRREVLRLGLGAALLLAPATLAPTAGAVSRLLSSSAAAKDGESSNSGSGGGGNSGSNGGGGSSGSGGGGNSGSGGGNSGRGGGDDDGRDDGGHHGGDRGSRRGPDGERIEYDGRRIRIIYPNGFREEIADGIFEMRDAVGRRIVRRRATPEDYARMRALGL